MIPKEILEQALADYEKAVEEIRGMEEWEAVEYLKESQMRRGLCYYLEVKFDVSMYRSECAFGNYYLGGIQVVTEHNNSVPALTARLQLRINKLKELLEK